MKTKRATGREVRRHLIEARLGAGVSEEMRVVLEEGCLARRMLGHLGLGAATAGDVPREKLRELAGRLCGCLETGRMFVP